MLQHLLPSPLLVLRSAVLQPKMQKTFRQTVPQHQGLHNTCLWVHTHTHTVTLPHLYICCTVSTIVSEQQHFWCQAAHARLCLSWREPPGVMCQQKCMSMCACMYTECVCVCARAFKQVFSCLWFVTSTCSNKPRQTERESNPQPVCVCVYRLCVHVCVHAVRPGHAATRKSQMAAKR